MQNFKVGDKVKLTTVCTGMKADFVYTVETRINGSNSQYLCVMDEGGWSCLNTDHWQLISPKERDIENVQVGDVLIDYYGGEITVQEVLEKCFAYTTKTCENLLWKIKDRAKQYGWKIKQPQDEIIQGHTCSYPASECSRCEKSEWLEKGEKIGYIATSLSLNINPEQVEWIEKGIKEGWLKEGRIIT